MNQKEITYQLVLPIKLPRRLQNPFGRHPLLQLSRSPFCGYLPETFFVITCLQFVHDCRKASQKATLILSILSHVPLVKRAKVHRRSGWPAWKRVKTSEVGMNTDGWFCLSLRLRISLFHLAAGGLSPAVRRAAFALASPAISCEQAGHFMFPANHSLFSCHRISLLLRS